MKHEENQAYIADIPNTKMHFLTNTETHYLINLQLIKHENGRNGCKSNFLKIHCSSKLPIKHISQLNNLSKLPITQLFKHIAQFLQMYGEIKKKV